MLSNALQRRTARRASTVVLAVGALLAGGAVSASAATIDGTDAAPIFNDAAAQANNVTVTQDANTGLVSFHDGAGALTTTVCTPNTPVAGDVTCGSGGPVTSITLNLGDGGDTTAFSGVTAAIVQNGGAGVDTLAASDASLANTINGDAGDDILNGGAQNDTLNGGADNDTIAGGDGNDTIDGGGGDDTISNDAGSDDIHGGTGTDTMIYTGPGPGPSDVVASLDDIANDGIAGENDNVRSDVEAVLGDSANGGNDTMHGGPGADLFEGFDGDDSIDLIDGGADLGVACDAGGDVVYADSADVSALGFDPLNTCEAVADKDAMSFGSLTTGQSSGAQTVTILNHSLAAIALGTVASNGQFNKTADTCSNTNLAAGATCAVSMTFAPSSAGALAGTLSIPTAGRAVSIPLSGTGVAATVVTPPPGGGVTPPPPPPPPPPAVVSKPAAAKSVSTKASPTRDRSKPYSFTFTGKVTLPAGVTKANGCSGSVTITLKKGTKTVKTKKLTLKKDCTYKGKVTVTSKAKMKAKAKFGGNSKVGAKSSAAINVRAG